MLAIILYVLCGNTTQQSIKGVGNSQLWLHAPNYKCLEQVRGIEPPTPFGNGFAVRPIHRSGTPAFKKDLATSLASSAVVNFPNITSLPFNDTVALNGFCELSVV